MSFLDILSIIIPAALYTAAPLIFTALGAVFSEKSGVIGLGVEGLMVFGAFSGVLTTLLLEGNMGEITPWLAILIAAIASGIFSLIYGVAVISLRADQTVTGVAINMLAVGLTLFLIKKIFNKGQTDFVDFRIDKVDFPVLSDIPVIGDIFFSGIPYTSYIAIAMAFVVWYIIYKTPFGLRLRSVGEHPAAADTMGINVNRTRYIAVILSGVFAGVGGAVYALSISGNFTGHTIAGQGFLAIAAMIFGKWHPVGAMAAALFFGFAQSLGITGAQIPFLQDIPSVFLIMAPYILTILALTGFVGRAEAPKASGVPYIKGTR
ncbi:ABC transporter permease [Robertmurraya yapensis]|uniref:ABC transporter permease n=2 Tax=Bacillaceae TaxID=186817 RepID=A0A431WJT3_9BACI|nr:ABC transporter permease [Bacillus yapensis]RTR35642.1 ABC transporter permease [Bacillus yapensis]TKS98443.1 ABC transporter permease [Bacillus yapensis]